MGGRCPQREMQAPRRFPLQEEPVAREIHDEHIEEREEEVTMPLPQIEVILDNILDRLDKIEKGLQDERKSRNLYPPLNPPARNEPFFTTWGQNRFGTNITNGDKWGRFVEQLPRQDRTILNGLLGFNDRARTPLAVFIFRHILTLYREE